jgi:hypothetical protein
MEYSEIIRRKVYRIGEGVVNGDCGIAVTWASLAGISLYETRVCQTEPGGVSSILNKGL